MSLASTIHAEDRKVGVDRLLSILQRRAWLLILLVTAGVTVTFSVVLFLPEIYRSTATVLVERPQVPEDFVRSTITREVDSRLQEISQEIMSRARLESLIERHRLYPDLRSQRSIDEVVQRMRHDIRLDLQGVSRTNARDATVAFTVSYIGTDPETVAEVANELAETYIEEDVKVRQRQAAGTADFLRGELEEMKRQLENQETAVKDFKERHMGELPQQQTANLSMLERLSAQLLLNSERQALAHERQVIVEKQRAAVGDPKGVTPDTTATRLDAARRELSDLRKRFTDRYPDVVRLRAEIAELEADARAAGNSAGTRGSEVPESLGQADGARATTAEMKVLKSEEERLKRQIAEYEERIENTPRREQEYRALRRDYETTRQVYESLLKRFEEAKLAESLEQNQKGEQFRILDPALVADRPVAPNRPRLLLLGVLLSFGLAAMAAAVTEAIDPTIHSAEELRSVSDIPVLVSIPRIVTATDRRGVARRLFLGATSTIAGVGVIVAASYFIANQNTWLAALLS